GRGDPATVAGDAELCGNGLTAPFDHRRVVGDVGTLRQTEPGHRFVDDLRAPGESLVVEEWFDLDAGEGVLGQLAGHGEVVDVKVDTDGAESGRPEVDVAHGGRGGIATVGFESDTVDDELGAVEGGVDGDLNPLAQ